MGPCGAEKKVPFLWAYMSVKNRRQLGRGRKAMAAGTPDSEHKKKKKKRTGQTCASALRQISRQDLQNAVSDRRTVDHGNSTRISGRIFISFILARLAC